MDTAATVSQLLFESDETEQTFIEDVENSIVRLGKSIPDTLRWAMLMPTALDLLGRFRVERQGKNKGRFNIRTHGIDPLVASVWGLAVLKGIGEHGTLKRIFTLRVRNIISVDMESALTKAYECFTEFLLRQDEFQQSVDQGQWVSPSRLTRIERNQICAAMQTVEHFQKYIYENAYGKPEKLFL